MQLTSTAFRDGETIPARYTCEGNDVSPPLAWEGVPEHARSLALVVHDPDAPAGDWVHWVVYDLPVTSHGLPEAVSLDGGGREGSNDFGKRGYGGPCPPRGTHRYLFELFALDTRLTLGDGASRAELMRAIDGHVLAQARLMGLFAR